MDNLCKRLCEGRSKMLQTPIGNKLEDPFTDFQVFLTVFLREMNPTSLSVNESLTCVSFFDNHEQQQHLLTELSTNLSEAADVDRDFDQLHWWRLHVTTLRHWSAATKKWCSYNRRLRQLKESFHSLKCHLERGNGPAGLCRGLHYAAI